MRHALLQLDVGQRRPAAGGHDLGVALDGRLHGRDVGGAQRRIALGRGGLPLLDEGLVGRIALGGVGRARKSRPAVLVARSRQAPPRGPQRARGPRQAQLPSWRSCSVPLCWPARKATSRPERAGIRALLEKQKHCEVREIGGGGAAWTRAADGCEPTARHPARTAARPGGCRGRPCAPARRAGPPRRCGPGPAPGCGWRAARWPAGGR